MIDEEKFAKPFYEAVESFKALNDFSHDRNNIQECEFHLSHFQYQPAYSFVQRLLAEYETSMNSVSEFNNGQRVIINQTPSVWSEEKIKSQLLHFHNYIPAYAFAWECKKELAKTILFGLAKGLKTGG